MVKEPLTQAELGRRLRAARDAVGLTQEQAARHLNTSRSTIAQIELGNRGVESLELVQLATLYHRDLKSLLSPELSEADPVKILMRAEPGITLDAPARQQIAWCHELCRARADLESLLEIDERRPLPPTYQLASGGSKWRAIQEGDHLAAQERSRLQLGDAPVRDMAALLETQGVNCAELPLPSAISGVFIASKQVSSSCLLVNSGHHPRRQQFSYAHEYCHVLADRARGAGISHDGNQDEYFEVRANAFAAAFLVPAGGVLAVLASLGKLPARTAEIAAVDGALRVKGRPPPRATDGELQVCDVVRVADHFGVSYKSAAFRLKNLGHLNDERLEFLLSREEEAREVRRREPGRRRAEHQATARFRQRLLELAIEAYRQEEISWSRLGELGALAKYSSKEVAEHARSVGLDPSLIPYRRQVMGKS